MENQSGDARNGKKGEKGRDRHGIGDVRMKESSTYGDKHVTNSKRMGSPVAP